MIINDVHIRYEDSEADPSRPFSVGVVIDNISAQSTDENWVHALLVILLHVYMLYMHIWLFMIIMINIIARL